VSRRRQIGWKNPTVEELEAPTVRGPELVFAYGSLMFPEVCEAVIGRVPTWSAAHLAGWFASEVPGGLYPALVPRNSAVTDGLLLEGITESEIEMLDRYEGPGFTRTRVSVEPGGIPAWVWVARRVGMASGEPWDPAAFESRLSEYLGH
jgi:gamma-glutamylcyclotransferase (GGCT)/AIG2-like uncharacterized protein YtfP